MQFMFGLVAPRKIIYRVTMQVSDLGWVDSDLACSLILLKVVAR